MIGRVVAVLGCDELWLAIGLGVVFGAAVKMHDYEFLTVCSTRRAYKHLPYAFVPITFLSYLASAKL